MMCSRRARWHSGPYQHSTMQCTNRNLYYWNWTDVNTRLCCKKWTHFRPSTLPDIVKFYVQRNQRWSAPKTVLHQRNIAFFTWSSIYRAIRFLFSLKSVVHRNITRSVAGVRIYLMWYYLFQLQLPWREILSCSGTSSQYELAQDVNRYFAIIANYLIVVQHFT